ncbi:aspartate-tRNA ligase [Clavulina sp. PMI_390]|nr:aspartate-tRNA ligase [Clavulina sp. PMI_390]
MSEEQPQQPAPAAAPAPAPAAAEGETPTGPSKNELKKAAKKAEKERLAAEKAAKAKERQEAQAAAEPDYATENYGPVKYNVTGRPRTKIAAFTEANAGEDVVIRARVHTSRVQGNKMVFLALRQQIHTIQAIVQVNPTTISKQMVKWAASLDSESIVLIEGKAQKPGVPVESTTVHDCEVIVEKIYLVSGVAQRLPFSLEDASRTAEEYEMKDAEGNKVYNNVGLDTRLNNRVLDLRTPVSQSIFTIQAGVTSIFRSFLESKGFVEIHSPKLQGAATESGASVFEVSYFKGKAYLAQSPQLAKQMAIAADYERVFEIGPVFRAENAFTHRHLTEFTGLDLEMAIEESYEEVVDVLDGMLLSIFGGLKQKYAKEIEVVQKQFPAEDFVWLEKTLRLKWGDAIALLRENKVEIGDFEDLNTEQEKFLGKLVKEKYKTDYYILDKFPLAVRPFYTMPDPEDARYSNSYDFMMRGQEILSGAQRVHDPALLEARMVEAGITPASMKGYLDSFKMGMPPHGGGGIGLERVVMLFLELGNIRRASMFPRDPKRLEP